MCCSDKLTFLGNWITRDPAASGGFWVNIYFFILSYEIGEIAKTIEFAR